MSHPSSRRSSFAHDHEREHGEVAPLRPFEALNPFKRAKPNRTASTSSATLENPGSNVVGSEVTGVRKQITPRHQTPVYISATDAQADSAKPGSVPSPPALQRLGSRPAVVCPFGSVSPDHDDPDLGFYAVRSSEEAEMLSRRYSNNANGGAVRPGFDPVTRTRSRGMSLIGAAANIATAGFGMGESDQEIVQRTLSRVSTRRAQIAQGPVAGAPVTVVEREGEEHDNESRSGRSISDHTVVATDGNVAMDEKKAQRDIAGAGVGISGGEGGGAINAERMAKIDLEKGARPGDAAATPAMTEDGKDDDHLWMVKFDPGEKANPKNWSVAFRWYLTGAGGLLVLNSTFASSAPSGVVAEMIEYFGFGREVAVLTISLFVAGYCVGPLMWGPLSESFGRRPIFLIAFLGYIGFQVGCALSKNTASILIFRFLGGVFAACPLTNAGALLADIWDADRRGIAMAIFSLSPFAGPALGPIVGGYIGVSGVTWRWLFWVLTIFASLCGLVVLFTLPETYAPILLVKKAQILRKETGDQRWWAPLERREKSASSLLQDVLVKPAKILALEPMLIAITVYMSFVYGCVYLLFEAYPIVFGAGGHNFRSGAVGLMFLGMFLGGVLAVILYVSTFDRRYRQKSKALAPNPVPPEARLEATLLAAPLLAVSFFWFGWTSYPSIHWISPCLAGGLLGFSVLNIFVSLFNYIVDTYLFAAASALSANTVCRSLFGAVFPLFATQMYEALNPRWASSLLGFIALIMVPIPFVLIKFGPTLRAKSRFTPGKK